MLPLFITITWPGAYGLFQYLRQHHHHHSQHLLSATSLLSPLLALIYPPAALSHNSSHQAGRSSCFRCQPGNNTQISTFIDYWQSWRCDAVDEHITWNFDKRSKVGRQSAHRVRATRATYWTWWLESTVWATAVCCCNITGSTCRSGWRTCLVSCSRPNLTRFEWSVSILLPRYLRSLNWLCRYGGNGLYDLV